MYVIFLCFIIQLGRFEYSSHINSDHKIEKTFLMSQYLTQLMTKGKTANTNKNEPLELSIKCPFSYRRHIHKS